MRAFLGEILFNNFALSEPLPTLEIVKNIWNSFNF